MSKKHLQIGAVFTPLEWGFFAIEAYQLFPKWLQGATIFDPTMGEGNLLEALVAYGLQQGYKPHELPLDRLFGNELHTPFYERALGKFQEQFQIDMSANFWNEDILEMPARPFDIVLGNPPWQNFVDLPEDYKPLLKERFEEFDLLGNKRGLLLGNARIDLAALVIQRVIKDFLNPKGTACFFSPLSLLLNDGAHQPFRSYSINEVNFALRNVYDFNEAKIFDQVATRYGLLQFIRDEVQTFPIDYFSFQDDRWKLLAAKPLFQADDPLSVFDPEEHQQTQEWPLMQLKKESSPRQGVNTCGANAVFFFDECHDLGNGLSEVNGAWQLPTKYIFPLLTKDNFEVKELVTHKWVLLPYDLAGKPLSWASIEQHPTLTKYLLLHQEQLINRKGVLINSYLQKGCWWALLGVGPYSFFPFKVVWQAYGRKTFDPKLVKGHWQANQSLQAFIPLQTLEEAKEVLAALQQPQVEHYLHSLQMAGTMNWAQPGKIKKMLKLA